MPTVLTSSPVASSRLRHAPALVEDRARALLLRLRIEDRHALEGHAERARGSARDARDDDRVLGRAEPVDDLAAEAPGERRDVPVAGLVAEREPQRVVGIVGLLGGGEHVGERLAHVVHVRRAVAAYVGDEPARGELLRQRHAAAGRECGTPSRHHRVGVEQRHRDVEDVVGPEPEALEQVGAREGDLLVGDPHGLGVAARARGEDQHEQRVGIRSSVRWCSGRLLHRLLPRRLVADHQAYVAEVDALDQGQQTAVRHDHLAVRLADVGQQRLASARGVQPDRDVRSQSGGAELEGHLRGVVHQQPDVARPVGWQQCVQGVRATGTGSDVLPPGPALVTGQQRGPVVLRARQQRVPDRRHAQAGSSASIAPIVRDCSVVPPRANSSRFAAVK